MWCNNPNKLHGIIRPFCALDNICLTLLYKAIVRPHFIYATTIRNAYSKGYIDDLEKVQCKATKLLHNISHLSYPDHLAAVNLPTLAYCGMRGDMIKAFKILNNSYDSSYQFYTKSNFCTQGDITRSSLYNMQTATLENCFSQSYCRHLESASFKGCKCTKHHMFKKET